MVILPVMKSKPPLKVMPHLGVRVTLVLNDRVWVMLRWDGPPGLLYESE